MLKWKKDREKEGKEIIKIEWDWGKERDKES